MRTVVAIILLILIISLGVFEQVYLNRTFTELEERINRIISVISDQDLDYAIELTEHTIEWWDKKLKIFELILPHEILNEVSLELYNVLGQLEGDDDSQAIGAAYVLIGICETSPHTLGFRIQHIL